MEPGDKGEFPHQVFAEGVLAEEDGAIGTIEPRHLHLYIHSKGVFWQAGGVQEFVAKAFLMEVHQTRRPEEANRKPIWVCPEAPSC